MITIPNQLAERTVDLQDPDIDYEMMLKVIAPQSRVAIWRPAGRGLRGQEWNITYGRCVFRGDRGWVINVGRNLPEIATEQNLVNFALPGHKWHLPWTSSYFSRFKPIQPPSRKNPQPCR